jgi:MtN3 and saliva related transmembrane protein
LLNVEYLGLAAGFLTNIANIPQIYRIIKRKSAYDISLLYNSMMFTGVVGWLVYGIAKGSVSLIAWNIIGTVLNGILFYAKLRYGRVKPAG